MSEPRYRLVIGNKNTSSWSLRPWLLMRRFLIPFEEIAIDLRAPDVKEAILAHSPSGLVPALIVDDEMVVWDSLAIAEYLAEHHADRTLWPAGAHARAIARSVSAEMHSGFAALRREMPMDFARIKPVERAAIGDAVEADIRRIVTLWRYCRQEFGIGGPFLFGDYTIADTMYVPVASRFRTYGVDLAAFGDDGTAAAYVETVLSMPEIADWRMAAEAEVAGQTAE